MENSTTSAFPIPSEHGFKGEDCVGLSKREYAAIHIMSGLAAKYTLNKPEDQEIISNIAIELADTLCKKL